MNRKETHMNEELTPEEQAAIEDAELQEAEIEAFRQGWNDSRHDCHN